MSKDIFPAAPLPAASSPAAPEAGRPLSPAAQRALVEAAERRARAGEPAPAPKEIDGRGGPEPVRYGDWEVKGIASDF
ncbi:DUF1674 domain-containing protein [Ancylobacter sp. A5.8]|uniref:DUF1674 domain-containing protein n=1 Tax=Ancylobacter gelatini TaxID=2919920 RepID=UPI001F4DECCA|nr:DUF1674 domain-containing protein [Ancylobacter gelatini]MCJ8143967.1 DUF1674 domain-containing protein [Ancylobacter gelatini]